MLSMQMQIDPASQARIAQLAAFGALLAPALADATLLSLDAMQNKAVDDMLSNMIDPQGPLEDAFYQVIEIDGTSIEGELVNPSPYAWRQEEGFSGMTDSLGRYFEWTPEYHYMQHARDTEIPAVEQYFSDAVDAVIAATGG